MKLYNNHHSLIVLLLLLVLSSCHATYKVSTQAISLKETDSITIKEESLPIKGLHILLVSQINSNSLIEPTIMISEGSSELNRGGTNRKITKGYAKNQFYNQVASTKVANMLTRHSDVTQIDCINKIQIDSLCRKGQFDLIVINNGIDFSVNQEAVSEIGTPTTDNSNQLINTSVSTIDISFMGGSYSSTVYYLAHWSLYWKDNSEESGFRKQTILQQGGFWNPKNMEPQSDILSCALKAGEDFARLFK